VAAVTGYYELDSGILIPDSEAVRRKLAGTRPKCVDLFSGCGGFSCGMIQGGWEVVAAVDNDPCAAHTYMLNLGKYPCQFHFVTKADAERMEKSLSKIFKRKGDQIEIFETAGSGYLSAHPDWPGVGHFFMGDITKIKGHQILDAIGLEVGELDAVVGSPPCQGFSRANGRRGPDDPRNQLVWEFARLVCELQPKSMILENVPEFATMTTPEGLLVIGVFTRILEDGNFAGVDALKAAMKHQLGVTIMRNKKPAKKAAKRQRRRR
jgi:DNA (cytosine-5)-methyltransferase 1